MNFPSAFADYSALGFDVLPLRPGEKKPLGKWGASTAGSIPSDSNIGVRGGGQARVAVLDCDHPETFDHALAWLAGMGLNNFPLVQTASGIGRHVYFSFDANLSGNYKILRPEFGAGEFRYGAGCYVVAPPSIVDNSEYKLLTGSFQDLPHIDIADVRGIIKASYIPEKAYSILQGNGAQRFHSRSDAEQSILAALANQGASFEDVLHLFRSHPAAGKFSELYQANETNAIRWLRMSYDNAIAWTQAHESAERLTIKKLSEQASERSWQGRTARTDRQIYLAHLSIAYRVGRLTYGAAAREIAELAGVNYPAAINGTLRLCKINLLQLVHKATSR